MTSPSMKSRKSCCERLGLVSWKNIRLKPFQIALISGEVSVSPHRKNRTKPKTQDGRILRRYQRRWKIERLFSWLKSFRRLRIRHEWHEENYEGMAHLGCIALLLRRLAPRS